MSSIVTSPFLGQVVNIQMDIELCLAYRETEAGSAGEQPARDMDKPRRTPNAVLSTMGSQHFFIYY